MQYIYLLKCNDGSIYTGCTQDLEARIQRHQKGYITYTKDKLPVSLEFYCAFNDSHKAYEFEGYLKTGSGMAFRNKHFI